MSADTLELRWERYLAMFGPYGLPREAFDHIATARAELGSRGLHRIWVTNPNPTSLGSSDG